MQTLDRVAPRPALLTLAAANVSGRKKVPHALVRTDLREFLASVWSSPRYSMGVDSEGHIEGLSLPAYL